MLKYLLILAACIALPIYLYFNQNHQFPISGKYYDTSGKEVMIKIIAQSDDFVHFIHPNDNQYIGQEKTYILSHKHLPNELVKTLDKYPKNFAFAEFPCVIEFSSRQSGDKLATVTGKDSVFIYYHDRGSSRIESLPLSSLDYSTKKLLTAFPKSRNDREYRSADPQMKLPWKTTLETKTGTVKPVTIYKRSTKHVLLSIDDQYNIYKYPIDKLNQNSIRKVESIPASPAITEDIDAIKRRYQFTLKQLKDKEARLKKYKPGTFQYQAVVKEITKIKDDVTLAKNKLHHTMGL